MDSLNQSQTLSSTSDNGSSITDIQKGSSMNTETTSTAGLGIKTLNDHDLIFCEIRKGKDYYTQVSGTTIVEVLEKIKDYHTMGNVAKQHYTKKGRLEKELSTGWYLQEAA